MKFALLSLLLAFLPQLTFAKVEMKSFYFKSNTSELQPDSNEELEELKRSMKEFNIQLIELNAYTENTQFNKDDKSLAQKRINYTLKSLEAEDKNLTVNNFGNDRIKLDFNPLNWERVDIYFVKYESVIASNDNFQENTHQPLQGFSMLQDEEPNNPVSTIVESNEAEELNEVNHVNLHLNFVEGKARIRQSSEENLDFLLEILKRNPTLKANIRGHVCCGDNMSISKRRARRVHRYLIKNGIDRDRLQHEGLSNSEPLVSPELTSHDRRMNRRVEVVFNEYIQL